MRIAKYQKSFTLVLEQDIFERLKESADKNQVSLAEYARFIFRDYYKIEEPKLCIDLD